MMDVVSATGERLITAAVAPMGPSNSRTGYLGKFGSRTLLGRAWRGGAMRVSIAVNIFSIALGLLVLMGVAALLSLRMTQTVDSQLVIVDQNYFPAYVSLVQANIRSVEESALIRRVVLALLGDPAQDVKRARLPRRG